MAEPGGPPAMVEARVDWVVARAAAGDWPAVEALLTDGRWEVRREALRAHVELKRDGWMERCIEFTVDRAQRLRRYAAEMLRQAGEAALPVMREHLGDPGYAPWLAGVLACSLPGRRLLRELPDEGRAVLLAAAAAEGMAISPYLVNVAKALVVCSGDEVGDCLAELRDRSPMLRNTAGRALYLRGDARAVPWAIERLRGNYLADREIVDWLGSMEDPRALPILRKLSGFWSRLWITAEVRRAAREAVARIEATLDHIADGALSRAPRPGLAPSEAALSFWSSDEDEET